MGGKLYCITGPSGSGKTSIARKVFTNECVSITTRPMRDGEVDGVDYYFITKEEFETLFENNELIEAESYDDNYYGLTLGELEGKTKNRDAFFVCTYRGMEQIKKKYDDICSVFLYASEEDCYDNMLARGDSHEKAEQRMKSYDDFMRHMGKYQYVMKNNRGSMDISVLMLHRIIMIEESKGGEQHEPSA